MYIVANGNRYSDIKGRFHVGDIVYTGESITGIESVSGKISCFADDGFLFREDNVSDYLRCVVSEGSILLTNTPAPSPEPEPEPEPEQDIWAEMAEAIKDGINHVD